MRVLIVVIVLIFSLQSLSKADDIKNLEIEGITIGDSLLDFMSKKEIDVALENPNYYKDNEYVVIFTNIELDKYDELQVTFKPNDKKFIIHSIMLVKKFDNQIEKCKKEKEKIITETLQIISNAERENASFKHGADKTGNSISHRTSFFFKSGGYLNIMCNDYGKEVFESDGWVDSLTLSIGSDEFKNFLLDDPY
tara:strand:+ start:530 stop:1114 length:585 start_codon:yes stop_codon:yes gene_type:complete